MSMGCQKVFDKVLHRRLLNSNEKCLGMGFLKKIKEIKWNVLERPADSKKLGAYFL